MASKLKETSTKALARVKGWMTSKAKRRLKIVRLDPSVIYSQLEQDFSFVVMKGVPKSAKPICHGYDVSRDQFYFILSDPSFDEVEEGSILPELRLLFTKLPKSNARSD